MNDYCLCLGETPLHVSARSGHDDVAKYLISRGAEINIEDVYGK